MAIYARKVRGGRRRRIILWRYMLPRITVCQLHHWDGPGLNGFVDAKLLHTMPLAFKARADTVDEICVWGGKGEHDNEGICESSACLTLQYHCIL